MLRLEQNASEMEGETTTKTATVKAGWSKPKVSIHPKRSQLQLDPQFSASAPWLTPLLSVAVVIVVMFHENKYKMERNVING